jgi:histidyl-tRNA synthetase
MSTLQSVRGMNDVLPESADIWHFISEQLRSLCNLYGYREIRTPLLERTELFKRTIGEQTDIVEKEMYTFIDNNGESVTLRPEATASCVRASVEHGLVHNKQAKLWYFGPMFRHEKPQKGRYRQFHQFGIEALGWPGPDIDAELLIFASRLWKRLGVQSVKLEINTLGSSESRENYKNALVEYLSQYTAELDEDSQRRLFKNPLRILDSKNTRTREILKDAPNLFDYLDDSSLQQFTRLQAILAKADVQYTVNPGLVRGLDYYTSTVFEWVTDKLGAQSAVLAGGRYDGLVTQLGGKPTPAAGFAMGIERLIELVLLEGPPMQSILPEVYMVTMGDLAELEGIVLAETLRDSGIRVHSHFGGGNFKKQFKKADQSGARYAVVLGETELQQQMATIKDLRTESEQLSVPFQDVAKYLGRGLDTNC